MRRFFANFARKTMPIDMEKSSKLYYSIKEVAKMFDVNESTLRYWETAFPNLKPKTVATTKVRQYTDKDIEEVRIIYNLIKVRGFKIAAARKYLHDNRTGADKTSEVIEALNGVKDELKELKRQLELL